MFLTGSTLVLQTREERVYGAEQKNPTEHLQLLPGTNGWKTKVKTKNTREERN